MFQAESNLSISSITSESSTTNEDSEIVMKTNSMLKLLSEVTSDYNSENLLLEMRL